MRTPRRRRAVAGLLLAPLLTGCFASDGGTTDDASGDGSRLRVALAFPPAENFSPYGADATLLSRLGVTEGLTKLMEPLLILFLGGAVGFIVIALFIPLVKLIEGLSK